MSESSVYVMLSHESSNRIIPLGALARNSFQLILLPARFGMSKHLVFGVIAARTWSTVGT